MRLTRRDNHFVVQLTSSETILFSALPQLKHCCVRTTCERMPGNFGGDSHNL